MYPLLIAGFFMSIMKASAQAGFWTAVGAAVRLLMADIIFAVCIDAALLVYYAVV